MREWQVTRDELREKESDSERIPGGISFRRGMVAMAVMAALCLLPVRLAAQAAASAAAGAGLNAEVIRTIESAESHVMALAEKFPAEKYSWHPEGARSTAEAFMHIASGNYSYANALGTPRPEGVTSESLSKITDKPQVIEALKRSFTQLKTAVNSVGDPEKTTKFRGKDTTFREIMMIAAAHDHEHLGQLIAYARVNGIVPPWSER